MISVTCATRCASPSDHNVAWQPRTSAAFLTRVANLFGTASMRAALMGIIPTAGAQDRSGRPGKGRQGASSQSGEWCLPQRPLRPPRHPLPQRFISSVVQLGALASGLLAAVAGFPCGTALPLRAAVFPVGHSPTNEPSAPGRQEVPALIEEEEEGAEDGEVPSVLFAAPPTVVPLGISKVLSATAGQLDIGGAPVAPLLPPAFVTSRSGNSQIASLKTFDPVVLRGTKFPEAVSPAALPLPPRQFKRQSEHKETHAMPRPLTLASALRSGSHDVIGGSSVSPRLATPAGFDVVRGKVNAKAALAAFRQRIRRFSHVNAAKRVVIHENKFNWGNSGNSMQMMVHLLTPVLLVSCLIKLGIFVR
eukprot:TRINITY_DN5753_c0_g3_i1.p1 TRINITY_DN5753_c0_g3~~TRINITY_DN5753_c0_g3_i1.p1  ORF type:complete len:372 (+),score=49.72 TRINITY_DN5753_c0_g3_i1:28-1116(+)